MRSLSFLSLFFVLVFAQISLANDCTVMGPGWYWDTYKNSCQYVNLPSSAKSTTSTTSKKVAPKKAASRNANSSVCSINNTSICTITQCLSLQDSDDRISWDESNRKCILDSSKQAFSSGTNTGSCDLTRSKNNPNMGASLDSNLRAHATAETLKPYEMPCVCNDGKTYVTYTESSSCELVSDADVQAKNSNTNIEQCSKIKDLAAKVQACQTTSKAAVNSCNSEDAKSSEESNSAILAGQKVLSTLGGLAVSKKAGSGEVDTCVISTLGTQTMWGVLDSMKDGCSSDFSSCQSACEEANNELANSKALLYECTGSLTEPDANLISEFNSIIESQKAEFEEANNQCNEKAKGQKSTLENTAERSMSSAQQAAKVCNCQNVPGATNCNNLPTLAQCKMNPGLVGCATYQNNCVANPNSPACACIMNPNGNACKLSLNNNPNLQGMVAALGSMPSQANSSGSFGSKLSASSLNDLNALLGEEATKVASGTPETAGPGSPFAQAQNSGGGGGGSGGGGVPATEGSGEGYTEEEKKGFGNGFITGAKNLLNDLLGGRKNGSAGGGSSGLGYKTKPNPDAWRPKLRIPGSAGNEYALGSKNKNIFDIMTKRYSDQNHTFIQNP